MPDPERPRGSKPFDRPDGYSGQDYNRADEAAVGRAAVVPGTPVGDSDDLPPDNGRRAAIDPRTGAVHGAGAGAGGGNPGEDFDSDAATGDGYPITGGEGADHTPKPLGPRSLGPRDA